MKYLAETLEAAENGIRICSTKKIPEDPRLPSGNARFLHRVVLGLRLAQRMSQGVSEASRLILGTA
jgi:hypothetical protein